MKTLQRTLINKKTGETRTLEKIVDDKPMKNPTPPHKYKMSTLMAHMPKQTITKLTKAIMS